MIPLKDTEANKLNQCKTILKSYYGPRFKGLILYGSVASKQASIESDIDLLLLLSEPLDYFNELAQIIELLYPVQLEIDKLLSVKPAVETEFKRGKLQLYRNIKREGKFL